MTAWRVGRATITPIIEVETMTSPRFLFKDLDKAGVLDVAERSPVAPRLVRRRRRLPAPTDPVPRRRPRRRARRRRHVRRQRQAPSEPGLERPAPAVPRRPRGRRLPRRHDRRGRVHPPARRPRRAGTRRSSTASGCRPSRAPATCSPSPSSSTGRRRTFPDGDDYLRRLGRALGRGGRRRPRSRRPCRRRGHPLRFDARPHSGSCVGRRRVRRTSGPSSPAT